MDRLIMLCFRSCLKGDGDNNEYYEILGLPDKNVNQDAIKKAFKKASLNFHPDKLAQRGIEPTAENKLQFLKLKEAYDVLSDPKRRRLYDDLGASGLKLVETPSQVNPAELIKNFQKNSSDRYSMALVVVMIFAALSILPILFCLKCDGTLGKNAPWVAIWTPMWLIDFVALALAALIFVDQQERVNEDGEPIEREHVPILSKVINAVTTILFVLIQVFLFLKLDRYINWNWFAIFSPWLAYEAVQVFIIIPVAFSSIPIPNFDAICFSVDDEESGESDLLMRRILMEKEYFDKHFMRATERKSLVGHLLRAWLAVFLALKLNGQVNFNWGLVLLPVWISFFSQYLFAYYFNVWGTSITESVDLTNVDSGSEHERHAKIAEAGQLFSASMIAVILTFAPAFMAILLVSRLEAASFTTFVIILPIFISLCCCCTGVFCGLTCLTFIDPDEITQDRTNGQNDTAGENPMGEGTSGYQPPKPVPATVASDANPADDSGPATPGLAYGTFKENTSTPPKPNSQPDLLNATEDLVEEIPAHATPHLLPQTTIDTDID